MTSRSHQLGAGPLTVGRVVNDALAMLRQSFARIAGVAVVFFALPALITAIAENALEQIPGQGLLVVIFAVAAVFVAVALRVLGPVAFAGFLDEAVAKEYLHGQHHGLADVLRELPWRPLVIADVIVIVLV